MSRSEVAFGAYDPSGSASPTAATPPGCCSRL